MKLHEVTRELVEKAVSIYQDLAYGGGRPRKHFEAPRGAGPDEVLALFHKEQIEALPGHACCRYTMRLGNRNYPFMKLLLQEHLVPGEFFFAVDTHDQMEIGPEFPDYEQWMAVRRFNCELKRRIEDGFEHAGLDTAIVLRRALSKRCNDDGAPCRGLVLIVDDEEDLACGVELLVRQFGFRTCKVHDGQNALTAARDLVPDLVLLDYELPELDGLQVLAAMRADPSLRRVPVLLNSAARIGAADVAKADGFLRKPFPASLLREMIERVLQQRGARP